jgi:transposase InsO family protein
MHYRAIPKDDDALRLALIRLAKEYGRYGYRMIAELLRVEGWRVNHKKVERLWREEGPSEPHLERRLRSRQAQQWTQLQDADGPG